MLADYLKTLWTNVREIRNLRRPSRATSLHTGLTLVMYWAGRTGSAAASDAAAETQQLSYEYVPTADAISMELLYRAAVIQSQAYLQHTLATERLRYKLR